MKCCLKKKKQSVLIKLNGLYEQGGGAREYEVVRALRAAPGRVVGGMTCIQYMHVWRFIKDRQNKVGNERNSI